MRLNGYATTGLILHSPNEGEVEGEIDLIGVRFSGHSQPDRIIECATELEIPTDSIIDIIIGEVKGGKNQLQFNESLRLHKDRVRKLFQWIGICGDKEIDEVIAHFMSLVQTKEAQKPVPFPILKYENISVRPILFAPDKTLQWDNQPKFINGKHLMKFCWDCFRPENRRDTCATDYRAVNNWGEQFERLVGYFKDRDREAEGPIEDLYKHFNVVN